MRPAAKPSSLSASQRPDNAPEVRHMLRPGSGDRARYTAPTRSTSAYQQTEGEESDESGQSDSTDSDSEHDESATTPHLPSTMRGFHASSGANHWPMNLAFTGLPYPAMQGAGAVHVSTTPAPLRTQASMAEAAPDLMPVLVPPQRSTTLWSSPSRSSGFYASGGNSYCLDHDRGSLGERGPKTRPTVRGYDDWRAGTVTRTEKPRIWKPRPDASPPSLPATLPSSASLDLLRTTPAAALSSSPTTPTLHRDSSSARQRGAASGRGRVSNLTPVPELSRAPSMPSATSSGRNPAQQIWHPPNAGYERQHEEAAAELKEKEREQRRIAKSSSTDALAGRGDSSDNSYSSQRDRTLFGDRGRATRPTVRGHDHWRTRTDSFVATEKPRIWKARPDASPPSSPATLPPKVTPEPLRPTVVRFSSSPVTSALPRESSNSGLRASAVAHVQVSNLTPVPELSRPPSMPSATSAARIAGQRIWHPPSAERERRIATSSSTMGMAGRGESSANSYGSAQAHALLGDRDREARPTVRGSDDWRTGTDSLVTRTEKPRIWQARPDASPPSSPATLPSTASPPALPSSSSPTTSAVHRESSSSGLRAATAAQFPVSRLSPVPELSRPPRTPSETSAARRAGQKIWHPPSSEGEQSSTMIMPGPRGSPPGSTASVSVPSPESSSPGLSEQSAAETEEDQGGQIDTEEGFSSVTMRRSSNPPSPWTTSVLEMMSFTRSNNGKPAVERIVISSPPTRIGNGASASIYLGTIQGEAQTIVALKMFAPIADDDEQRLSREVTYVSRLARGPGCERILPFMGIAMDGGRLILVSEFMSNGNLVNFLRRFPESPRRELIVQVAEGVRFLHMKAGIVHGDLKCENVLVTEARTAVIADFGLSTTIDKLDETTADTIRHWNTLAFAAPELLLDVATNSGEETRLRSKTPETDVYAFGMLVLQALTGQQPWFASTRQAILVKVCRGEKPQRPKVDVTALGLTDAWWSVCMKCWETNPLGRPSIDTVLAELQADTLVNAHIST